MSKPAFSDLFVASGRRNRKSYVLFSLAWLMLYIVAMTVLGIVAFGSAGLAAVLIWVAAIVLAIPGCFVGAQRCRDFGWTGWAIFITLIPVVGIIFYIALFFIPGDVGDNRYGPDPLAPAAAAPAPAALGQA